MEPDRQRIRRHGGQCRELGNVDSEAEEQDDGHGSAADRGDLEPVHGEAVVEARGPEVREQGLVHARAPAEDDRLDHVSSYTRQTRRYVGGQPASDAVSDAEDTAATPEHPERLSAQDHVDALPPQPLCLVEAVRRAGRSPQLAEELESRALRRRASERKLEQGRLVHAQRAPAKYEHLHSLVERPRPRRFLDLHYRPFRRADPGREHAAVELCQPQASPAPGDGDDRGREHRRSQARVGGCATDGAEGKGRGKRRENPRTGEVRKREAEAERADQGVRDTYGHLTGSPAP